MKTKACTHRDENFALPCQDGGHSGVIVRVVESGDLAERPEYQAGDRQRRRKVQIDDLDDTSIAETVQEECTALKKDRRLLRAEKLAAETDARFLLAGPAAGMTEANGKFRDTALVAAMTQQAEGRYGLFQARRGRETRGFLLAGPAAGMTEANGKFRDTALVAAMTQQAEGRYGLFQDRR